MKTFIGFVALFVVLPIWFYLIYQILVRVEASELMWFLFWIYVPVGILMGALKEIMNEQR